MIREAIETGGTRNLKSIQLAIETSGGLRYTAERAQKEVDIAIAALAPLPRIEVPRRSRRARAVRGSPPVLVFRRVFRRASAGYFVGLFVARSAARRSASAKRASCSSVAGG